MNCKGDNKIYTYNSPTARMMMDIPRLILRHERCNRSSTQSNYKSR